MVRRLFLPYYSKSRGPPRLRCQVAGNRGKKFLKLVIANQRDPRDGKHMEVLGSSQKTPVNPVPSAIGEPHGSLCDIRLRFSRIKFWLGIGCGMGMPIQEALAHANLIPEPPPKYGLRATGHFRLLSQIIEQQGRMHRKIARDFLRSGEPITYEPIREVEDLYEPAFENTPALLVAHKIYPPEMQQDVKIAESDDPFIGGMYENNIKIIRRVPR